MSTLVNWSRASVWWLVFTFLRSIVWCSLLLVASMHRVSKYFTVEPREMRRKSENTRISVLKYRYLSKLVYCSGLLTIYSYFSNYLSKYPKDPPIVPYQKVSH